MTGVSFPQGLNHPEVFENDGSDKSFQSYPTGEIDLVCEIVKTGQDMVICSWPVRTHKTTC